MSQPRTLRELDTAQLHALGALSTRAGGRAAQSLAVMLGLPEAGLQASQFEIAGAQDVAQALGSAHAVAVMFRLAGAVSGRFWLVAPQQDMLALAAALLRFPVQDARLDENTRGALAEAGNVVASSFVNVFADALRQVCTPSVPEVRNAPAPLLARLALDAADSVGIMRLEGKTQHPLRSTFIWSPDPLTLGTLATRVEGKH